MQRYKILLLVLLFVLTPLSEILAQNASYETNPYPPNQSWGFSIRGGGSFYTGDLLTSTEGDPGLLINGQVFYSLDRMWNMGVMAEWERHDVEVSGMDLGKSQTISIMPFIEFHYRAGRLSPYLSFGAGMNFNSVREDSNVTASCAALGVGACDFDPENTLAVRIGGGTDIFLTDHLAINIEGAWKLNKGDVDLRVGGSKAAMDDFNANVAQGMVGLKYYF